MSLQCCLFSDILKTQVLWYMMDCLKRNTQASLPRPKWIHGPLDIHPATNNTGNHSGIQHFPSETQTDMKQSVPWTWDRHMMSDESGNLWGWPEPCYQSQVDSVVIAKPFFASTEMLTWRKDGTREATYTSSLSGVLRCVNAHNKENGDILYAGCSQEIFPSTSIPTRDSERLCVPVHHSPMFYRY